MKINHINDIDNNFQISVPSEDVKANLFKFQFLNSLFCNQIIELKIVTQSCKYIEFSFDKFNIIIEYEEEGDWIAFYELYQNEIIALLITCFLSKGKYDFFWVATYNTNSIWIICLVWDLTGNSMKGMLCKRKKIDFECDFNKSYWYVKNDVEVARKIYANELFEYFLDKDYLNLPASFPLFAPMDIQENNLKSRNLILKITDNLGFKFFPFDYFSKERYFNFGLYKKQEWIISDKTFLTHFCQNMLIESEMKNAASFLKYAVIIINTYSHFDEIPLMRKFGYGTDIVLKLLKCFENLDFNGENTSLRCFFNPTADEIIEQIENTDTKYFFADFHTENGQWKINEKHGECNILEKIIALDLKHIHLMRVFHCFSVLTDKTKPTIVPNLLNTGIKRVEGSNIEENYLDYIYSLIYMFIKSDMSIFVHLKGEYDLITQANNFLNNYQYEKN